jgi:hypothetical protein
MEDPVEANPREVAVRWKSVPTCRYEYQDDKCFFSLFIFFSSEINGLG